MKLHVFNPSHDEALAAGYPYYYPTTIARQLADEWGALPGLWADAGDAVWLTDAAAVPAEVAWCRDVRFVRKRQLSPAFWSQVQEIDTWGWDLLVRHQLRRAGAPEHLLPTDQALASVRDLSSRRLTAAVLPQLRRALQQDAGLATVGESFIASSADEVLQYVRHNGGAMAKSLWSCSGRGVFRMAAEPCQADVRRVERLLREQGAVELEPLYRPYRQFALELESLPGGEVRCLGVSAFLTNASGAYRGNVVAPQPVLTDWLAGASDSLSAHWQEFVRVTENVMSDCLGGRYTGPLGIDMMLVDGSDSPGDGVLLHPCIEVNVRRTMGHVALTIAQRKLNSNDLDPAHRNLMYFCNSLQPDFNSQQIEDHSTTAIQV